MAEHLPPIMGETIFRSALWVDWLTAATFQNNTTTVYVMDNVASRASHLQTRPILLFQGHLATIQNVFITSVGPLLFP